MLKDIEIDVKEAKHLSAMDKNGASDPYCRLSSNFNKQNFKTPCIPKTLEPVWKNARYKFLSPPKEGKITIQLFDRDRFSRDDFLGRVVLDISSFPLNKQVDEWYQLLDEPAKPTVPKKDGKKGIVRLIITVSGTEKAKASSEKKEVKETLEDNYEIVKAGKHKKTGEKVAIKIINKKDTPEVSFFQVLSIQDELELLHREIDIMKKLKHPHIVQLLDLFETKDNLYLVLELVEGGELFDRIVERGHYSERDAADIVKQMLQGTQYMHDNGVAHRDLKPENVLCGGPEGTIVKIADFGLSKDFGGAALQTALGTPGYVAPEVLSGNPYDSAVDLWSIGVITYVLLCGFTPFYAENQRELFEQILSADFSFPSPEWDEISDSAKDFINHLLVVSPNERLTADTALEHPWIVNEAPSRELPQLKSFRNLMADTQKKAKKNR